MAFIDQVQDLTSLTVSDNDELSQFLKDGVIDVTSRWLEKRPQDMELFGRESSEQTSNGSLNLNGARIISVIREDGVTSNNWRVCRKISPSQQYLATDEESLSFASKFNPVYMIGDAGKISVFPAAGSDPNAFKVYYVNKDPVNGSGSALIHSHDDILYFPIDKTHLVVMYAGIKLLGATMGGIITDLSSFSATAVPPNFADAYEATTTDVPSGNSGEDIDAEIAKMQDYIEDDEDVDLAGAKAGELNMRFKRAMDKFNSGLQKYQQEIAGYSQEIQAEVGEQAQKIQTESAKYQWLQDRYKALQAEYMLAFITPQSQGGGR